MTHTELIKEVFLEHQMASRNLLRNALPTSLANEEIRDVVSGALKDRRHTN